MVLILSTCLRQLQTVVAQGRAHLMSRLAEPDGTTLLAVKRLHGATAGFGGPTNRCANSTDARCTRSSRLLAPPLASKTQTPVCASRDAAAASSRPSRYVTSLSAAFATSASSHAASSSHRQASNIAALCTPACKGGVKSALPAIASQGATCTNVSLSTIIAIRYLSRKREPVTDCNRLLHAIAIVHHRILAVRTSIGSCTPVHPRTPRPRTLRPPAA